MQRKQDLPARLRIVEKRLKDLDEKIELLIEMITTQTLIEAKAAFKAKKESGQ